ncbi:4-hydroxythreonine-4-phosphate dehydrogenase PdxA [Yoonia sp. BS5-3]|uniref:4-hydroxythreonine-4-phosphate dehydrogenase n=1 Tax=Yoonia phaeophyticola TaxID=3137369 RepID=A0ABZ2V6I6_9RHOB
MKPIAISCGEPAGIGPEIAVAAWQALRDSHDTVWIGDPRHLPAGTDFQIITQMDEARRATSFPVLAQDFGSPATAGTANPAHAQGVIDAIATGVDLVQSGQASALCTAPIHKAALIDGANFAYPGHTEYLAALAGVERVVMMLACDALRVVPTTIHIPLDQVATKLTASLLTDTLLITHSALKRQFGIAKPRIAVAGLNPHAGEDGKMGTQEGTLIGPVLDALRHEGMDISGPLSADTMFHAGARARYDVAVCMYHDQALIPIKTLDFSGGVNVTLGLPFIRTSPDHGTAFDIAGQGKADASSMIAAIKMAGQMAMAQA